MAVVIWIICSNLSADAENTTVVAAQKTPATPITENKFIILNYLSLLFAHRPCGHTQRCKTNAIKMGVFYVLQEDIGKE